MKNLALAAAAATLLCAFAHAGTYTWTGAAGDGLWFTAGNWDYEDDGGTVTSPAETSPGNAPADDVVISNGDTVTYVPGGDWIPKGNVLISGNSTLVQASGNAWPDIQGTVTLSGGGTYDTGSAGQCRISGTLRILSGGHLVPRAVLDGLNTGNLLLEGGTIACPGEFKFTNLTFENNGTAISDTLYSPQGNNLACTFHAGSLVSSGSSYQGYYMPGGSYINVAAGSTARFTMPVATNAVYSTYFSGNAPRFYYEGAPISATLFGDLFTVEEVGANSATFYLTPTGADAPVLGSASASAVVAGNTVEATFTIPVTSAGSPAARVTLVYGLSDGGMDSPDDWEDAVDLGEAEDGVPLSTTISGLDEIALYHYAFVATNGTSTVWTIAKTLVTPSSDPADAVWIGAVSTDSRVAANWFPEVLPGASSHVRVLSLFSQRAMDWWPSAGGDTVAAWTQNDIASHYVMFHTTTNAPLTITGDATVSAGVWTHSETSEGTPDTILNVIVGGDMTIGTGAFVTAGRPDGDNFAPPWTPMGFHRGLGPGYQRSAGASFAGDGGHTNAYSGVSYGSILDPLSYGSGGYGDGPRYAGGGIVKLVVDGTLTVNGTLCSRGSGYPLDNDYIGGAGSGGSVNVVCGSLAGNGVIDARGGTRCLYGSGSGGRIRLRLADAGASFADFTGTIEAVGGNMSDADTVAARDITPAAAGTIALQTADDDDRSAVVRVFNTLRMGNGAPVNDPASWYEPTGEGNEPSGTHLPSMQDGDANLSHTRWELSGYGALRLTQDVRALSLSLATNDCSQRVYTDGHVLTVKTLEIAGTSYKGNRYTAADLPGIVVGTGAVVVDFMPTMILVR